MYRVITSLWIAGLGLSMLICSYSPAHAQNKKALTIGLHSPALAALSRRERLKAIEDLARYMSEKLGSQVNGRNFARFNDLMSQARAGNVQLAIISAQIQAEQKMSTPLAVLARSGAATVRWQVLAKNDVATISQLKGKKIAVPRVGRQDQKFVTQVIFEGEILPPFFDWLPVADAESAITAVNVGSAEATVVPVGVSSSLKVLYTSRPIPSSVISPVSSSISSDEAKKITEALLAWQSTWPGYTGWQATNSGQYAALRSQLTASGVSRKPLIVKPKVYSLSDRKFFRAHQSEDVNLPSVIQLVRAPQWMPDQVP